MSVRKRGGLPLNVRNPKCSVELLEALEEGEEIIQEIKKGKRKGYCNVNEMMKAIMEDDLNTKYKIDFSSKFKK